MSLVQRIGLLALAGLAAACSNGGGTGAGGPPGADTTPDAFAFVDQADVAPGSVRTSAPVTITGIDSSAPVGVVGGSYSIGCGATFVTAPGTIDNNQTVCVRHTAAAIGSTSTSTTLTVGGVADTFTSTTAAAPPPGSAIEADFHTGALPPRPAGVFDLVTLSTMPDTVTGGDVLVALRGLAPGAPFTVRRNGTNVTASFTALPDGEVRGLVTGLVDGANTLEAASGSHTATLTVKNHPLTGPVLSGPHQVPFACRTNDAGLGDPLDANCSIATKYQWFYRSTVDQQFAELDDPFAAYPDDVQMTESADGRAVPFVVRVETATINRGIARIAVLDDPAARGAGAPFDAANWSRRIFQVFGESCGVGFHQGVNTPDYVLGGIPDGVAADNLLINFAGATDRLGAGDAVVHSTLAAFGNHCNPLISIETTMMVKEHISEQYGLVEAVVGTNGSGAALQQYNAANNAPGLISAALPTATFADIVTTAMTVSDCGLLVHYYNGSSLDWDDEKRGAVNGHLPVPSHTPDGSQPLAICESWNEAFFDRVRAEACPGAVPRDQRYHPVDNPGGVRCAIQDAQVNIWGRDPATGFARRPLDNVGIQYGLKALNDGAISFTEFIDLNRNIGGLDIDGNFVAARHVMDPQVEALAYRLGQVIGRGALAQTPVMDLAPYLDLIPLANIHEAVRPFVVRARLQQQTGQTATQSIWRGVATQPDAYPVMDAWLRALAASSEPDRVAAVTAAKPAQAQDSCVFATAGGRFEFPDALRGPLGFLSVPLAPGAPLPDTDVPMRLAVPEDFAAGTGACSTLLPVTATPRMVAGMPLSDDIIKCQLKAVDPADYAPALTAEQLAQVRDLFPGGVCDWTRPAAGDVESSMIWTSVGGAVLEPPHELKWRVGRSN